MRDLAGNGERILETLAIMMGLGMKAGNDYLRDGRSNALPSANVKCEDVTLTSPGLHPGGREWHLRT